MAYHHFTRDVPCVFCNERGIGSEPTRLVFFEESDGYPATSLSPGKDPEINVYAISDCPFCGNIVEGSPEFQRQADYAIVDLLADDD